MEPKRFRPTLGAAGPKPPCKLVGYRAAQDSDLLVGYPAQIVMNAKAIAMTTI